MADDTIQKLTDALLEKDKGTVLPIDLSTCYEYGMRGLCGTKCPDFGSKCECGEEVVMDKKICPLILISNRDIRCNSSTECIEHECAWWDKLSECCIVHALSCLGRR